jgi:hypothetical protein
MQHITLTLQYDTLRAMLASEMFLALCWIRKNKKEGERRGNLESLIKAATHNSKITREIERDKDNKQDIINNTLKIARYSSNPQAFSPQMTIKVQYACTISLPFGIPTSK